MNSLPLKLDLHVHTCYSYDATTTLREVVIFGKKLGLDGVAITDHDSVKAGERVKAMLKLARKKSFLMIPGIEVSTGQGHVLALNVATSIPPRLSPSETIELIHDAGGIAVAAHPVAVYKGGLGQLLTSSFDAIEVINSTAFPFFLSTHLSRNLAVRFGLPQTAGSDSHHAPEIGSAYTLVDTDSDASEIIQAIKRGATVPFGKPISWRTRIINRVLNPKRRMRKEAYSKSSI